MNKVLFAKRLLSAVLLFGICGMASAATGGKKPSVILEFDFSSPAMGTVGAEVGKNKRGAPGESSSRAEGWRWDFTNGDANGWRMGWNKTDETAITDFGVTRELGLALTLDFNSPDFGDANIVLSWSEPAIPASVSARILVPVANGKPRGPLKLGCAMSDPWIEDQDWPSLTLEERKTIGGVEYMAQTVTCQLGTKANGRTAAELVLRLGGENTLYKGPLYIQEIRAARK